MKLLSNILAILFSIIAMAFGTVLKFISEINWTSIAEMMYQSISEFNWIKAANIALFLIICLFLYATNRSLGKQHEQ